MGGWNAWFLAEGPERMKELFLSGGPRRGPVSGTGDVFCLGKEGYPRAQGGHWGTVLGKGLGDDGWICAEPCGEAGRWRC